MLDAYIIDSIRREEEARERDFERRRIHIQIEIPPDREPPRRDRYREEPFMGDPVIIPLITPDDIEEDAA